ncbi:nucleotidyltransferase family protein [Paucibacter sp. B2R-40]|uniref:nucleotidyltransferase domain-containing protein n=1 Tax=Paucibacter sp. B2R-40 TaxID=2893554 RepID=UPI0021E4CD00|nr:nucleotidyltransferase family protein [Paucibacter sp. B2R-40]MCV2353140.1 nucleotidyltransferase family protein [Paucibacter sp. B2R-40]
MIEAMRSELNVAAVPSLIDLMREPQRMRELSLKQWDQVLRLARSANLLGRLAQAAVDLDLLEHLPAQAARHLLATQRLTQHQQEAIEWECRHLEAALGSLQVRPVLLKGAAYAMSGHPAAKGRLFGDVDLLVPRASLNEAEAALMLHGWSIGKIDPYDQRYYRRWMHELPPMVSLKRGTVVDLHHNILPLTARHVPDAAALLAASVPLEGSCFHVLAPCDMVIHSATHLFHEGELKNGLRDLYDLDCLLMNFAASEPDFWRRLLERARELGLVWPVYLALRYTRAVLASAVPAEAMSNARAMAGLGAIREWCFDAMYLRAFSPDHPLVNRPAHALARAALYLRAHALRMPIWRLCLHLGRKAWLRLFMHSSRRV